MRLEKQRTRKIIRTELLLAFVWIVAISISILVCSGALVWIIREIKG